MTVDELRERLDDYDGDLEVRLMTQKSWPFENYVRGIVAASEIVENEPDEDDEDAAADRTYQPNSDDRGAVCDAVYLVEGSQIGYGTKAAWEVAS